jgi:hypothetical protein
MTRAPFAIWKPLPEATRQPRMDEVRGLIYHTPVGTMRGTWDYFAQAGVGSESTFLLGCPLCGDDLDGVTWQIMDADVRADANVQGNRYFGSVEMCDHGNPDRPLSPKQLVGAVDLGLWYRSEYGTPPRLCPTPTSRGFGWHAMWLDTAYMRADRTTPWSSAAGKVCPGAVRIRQLKTVVFPAVFAGRRLTEGISMADADDILREIGDLKRDLTNPDANATYSLPKIQRALYFTGKSDPNDPTHNRLQALIARGSGGDDGGPAPITVQLSAEQLAALTGNVMAAVEERLLPVVAAAAAEAVADEFAARLQPQPSAEPE